MSHGTEPVEASFALGQRERALRPVRVVVRNRVGMPGEHQSAGTGTQSRDQIRFARRVRQRLDGGLEAERLEPLSRAR